MSITLRVVNRSDALPLAWCRVQFERAVRETPRLHAVAPLQAVCDARGEFSHYADHETDVLWVGFALGLRAAERFAEWQKAAREATS